ncbi:MAG TPA: hypothetical protein PLV21_00915 [Cyclobacteriaceae bacterium]|nr:hypothetical protein [Cyclobacteriaceae bacterium]HRJ80414.1 hypothetical protein [Cyclobacteriaceae bacterium]
MKSRFYRGIEFVCVDDLPADQQLLLQASFPYPERINILMDGKITRNCIQYAAYTEWFVKVFKTSVAPDRLNVSHAKIPSATHTLAKA